MRPLLALFFLSLASAYILGLFLFAKGFLLSRLAIQLSSECTIRPNGEAGCGGAPPARFRRALVVIVDALRYDFAVFNDSLASQETRHFQNKLSVIRSLLSVPSRARLYRFVADPPTTTMQRIKGLTTGSLPTFIDAGSNFASSEITEDNFIDQLVRSNKILVFMGDDTWDGLYPKRFRRSFPYPSFNVQDLDTVDDGVIKNLVPEIRKSDWNLIVAHFLGVDHCGHRYGPNHPEMKRKLLQMNDVLREIVREMSNDTLLIVMGDHGMTKTGDHGGDSADEVDAALFVYSPAFSLQKLPVALTTVAQVDVVPTLSLLLGVPIPFSNVGSVIGELFAEGENRSTADRRILDALAANVAQVERYLAAYAPLAGDLPSASLEHLRAAHARAVSSAGNVHETVSTAGDSGEARQQNELQQRAIQDAISAHIHYLSLVKSVCQDVWAKFDVPRMAAGLALLASAMIVTIAAATGTRAFLRLDDSYDDGSEDDNGHRDSRDDGSDGSVLLSSHRRIFARCRPLTAVTAGLTSAVGLAAWVSLVPDRWAGGSNSGSWLWLVAAAAASVAGATTFAPLVVSVLQPLLRGQQAVQSRTGYIRRHLTAASCLVAVGLVSTGCFSNSFVVQEDRVVLFAVSSLLLMMPMVATAGTAIVATPSTFGSTSSGVGSLGTAGHRASAVARSAATRSKPLSSATTATAQARPLPRTLPWPLLDAPAAAWLVTCLVALRLARHFVPCREESPSPCVPLSERPLAATLAQLSAPAGSGNGSPWLGTQYLLVVAGAAGPALAVAWLLRRRGNLAGTTPLGLCATAGVPLAVASACLHWALQLMPATAWRTLTAWQRLLLPRYTYTLVGACLATAVAAPLATLARHRRPAPPGVGGGGSVSALYAHVRTHWSYYLGPAAGAGGREPADSKLSAPPPLVYGLGTAYSAVFLTLGSAILALLNLLLGDSATLSTALMALAMYSMLQLASRVGRCGYSSSSGPAVAIWSMMASYFFYATGHQATFPSIRWNAAFVGFEGDFSTNAIPATLVFLNTFASHIFFALMLPLLELWPASTAQMAAQSQTSTEACDLGEMIYYQDPRRRNHIFRRLFLAYLGCNAAKLLSTALAAALLRRHLMVWKIFAPHFIFEAGAFLASTTVSLMSCSLVARISHAVEQWLQELQKSDSDKAA